MQVTTGLGFPVILVCNHRIEIPQVSRIESAPSQFRATTTYCVDQIVNYVMTIYIIPHAEINQMSFLISRVNSKPYLIGFPIKYVN